MTSEQTTLSELVERVAQAIEEEFPGTLHYKNDRLEIARLAVTVVRQWDAGK